jgi:hypothetical protein
VGAKISSPNLTSKENRDWLQIFTEDVVERQ